MKRFSSILILFILVSGFKGFSQDTVYVRELITELSSETYFGRGYSKEGLQKSAQYLEQEMKAIGLKAYNNSFMQDFSYVVNRFPGKYEVTIDKKTYLPSQDFIVNAAAGEVSGEYKVFDVPLRVLKDSAKFVSLPGRKTKDKYIVLRMNELEDRAYISFLKSYATLNPLQAKGYIFVQNIYPIWSVKHGNQDIPIIRFDAKSFPEKAKKLSIKIDCESYETNTQNVIGYIPGTTDKTIAFSAHYDHLGGIGEDIFFPGAQDNASGVAMCLDVARYYMENPPEFNVLIMLFSGEEAGLLGSRYFTKNPLHPLKDIDFLINLDMIGTGKDGITLVNAKDSTYSNELNLFNTINDEESLELNIKARGIAPNSDHYPFNEAGVKAVFIYSRGGNTFYHHVNDTQETVSLFAYHRIFKLITEFAENYER